ncbi:hypothetical protein [Falsirhodobacter sp. 20TX0035]|uniref:hypothetical protein n=1 Tax=Falsirhodobacter sp. 20TX0035 TaxID=3022019 RepID=UPI00232CE714|nr:hypothetical protein [Falsirhodobacter sp. 20TX0035]MDB6454702.1 hypothetical protein [Falsirhodobacter sp. 20TX0035]
MASITNTSRAVRIINVKVNGKVKPLTIEPGATGEGEPVETASYKAAVASGVFKVEAKAAAKG